MEQGNNQPDLRPPSPPEVIPCANGCGFFGSTDTLDLCSKCFRESLRRAEAQQRRSAPTDSEPLSSSPATAPVEAHAAAAAAATSSMEDQQEEGTGRAKKGRCAACGRKVGLMGFECRCGGVFCGAHRYSDRHDCGYDYRGAGRDAIAQANPVVRADKVDKL